MADFNPLITLFSCSGDAGSALHRAGRQKKQYAAGVRPLRLCCLGQLNPGLLLRALALGADGVLVLGCPDGCCRFQNGRRFGEECLEETLATLTILGWPAARLRWEWIGRGDTDRLVSVINDFDRRLRILGPNPIRIQKVTEAVEDISLQEESKSPSAVEGAPPKGISYSAKAPSEPPVFTPEESPKEEELEPIFDVMTGKWLYKEK
ncbi:MAG: hydrogenase iron-sulfur subunit [bacterium]